jgi:hypothetical protein
MNKVDIVTEIFAIWDPMELIECGSPVDEYHPEAAKVTEYIDNDNPNVDDLAQYIQQIFATYFGGCFDLETCNLVASCILKNIEECEEE